MLKHVLIFFCVCSKKSTEGQQSPTTPQFSDGMVYEGAVDAMENNEAPPRYSYIQVAIVTLVMSVAFL